MACGLRDMRTPASLATQYDSSNTASSLITTLTSRSVYLSHRKSNDCLWTYAIRTHGNVGKESRFGPFLLAYCHLVILWTNAGTVAQRRKGCFVNYNAELGRVKSVQDSQGHWTLG